jgi:hypothetical protein
MHPELIEDKRANIGELRAGSLTVRALAHRRRTFRSVACTSRQMVTRGGHPSGKDGHHDPILYLTRRRSS